MTLLTPPTTTESLLGHIVAHYLRCSQRWVEIIWSFDFEIVLMAATRPSCRMNRHDPQRAVAWMSSESVCTSEFERESDAGAFNIPHCCWPMSTEHRVVKRRLLQAPALLTYQTEAALAAILVKDSRLADQYRRVMRHRGDKQAVVAVAQTILVIIFSRTTSRIRSWEPRLSNSGIGGTPHASTSGSWSV